MRPGDRYVRVGGRVAHIVRKTGHSIFLPTYCSIWISPERHGDRPAPKGMKTCKRCAQRGPKEKA